MTEQEFTDAMDQLHEAYISAWKDPEERQRIIQSAAQLAFEYDTQIASEQLDMVTYTQLPEGTEAGWNRLTGGQNDG